MFYINKHHVLQRCKIAKFSIVILEIAHGSSHPIFCKWLFRKSESKGFLSKQLKNTSEQVQFYQHSRSVNCTLTKK